MDGAAGVVVSRAARVRVPVELGWSEPEPYVAMVNPNKGATSYPFAEMAVGGKVLQVRGRALGSVRDAIKRYCRVQKAKDGKFKRRYAARRARDERGELVKVWRLA